MIALRSPRTRIFLILALLPLIPSPSAGESPVNRETVENIIREYILDNPEIVVEAIQRFQEKRQRMAEEADRESLVDLHSEIHDDPDSPVTGNLDGDVTLVEFFDYRCGVCRRVHPVVRRLVRTDPGIRRVFKVWPILGPDSVVAARAALAATRQAKFREFHNALMESKSPLEPVATLRIARSIGLDVNRLQRDMDDPAILRALERNDALATRLRLEGTPAFLIGDKIVRGGRDLDSMRGLVAEARKSR